MALSAYTAIENTPIAMALADAVDRHMGAGASAVKRSEHAHCDATRVIAAAKGS